MWDDWCARCMSTVKTVVDYETGSISCSACGFEFRKLNKNDFLPSDRGNAQNRSSDPVSITTTKPNNAFSDGVVRSDLANLQKSGFDPLSVATTKSNDASSNLGNLQNPSSKHFSTISEMANRLSLPDIVTNLAFEIFKKAPVKRLSVMKRNALLAACVFVACRQLDMTRSMEEISSVANGAKPSDISNAIDFIAETLGFRKDILMDIKPANFTTRFCNAVEVDSQAVQVAHEDAKRFNNKVDSNRSPVTIAAAIAYHTALVYHQRKLINALIQASGVAESTIITTLMELYPDPTRAPKESTKAKDQENLGST